MTPLEHYQRDLLRDDFNHDAAQAVAVEKLQHLFEQLTAQSVSASSSLFGKIRTAMQAKVPTTPITGLYFWGGVGRGKTYLMDVFFESLPFKDKTRLHFHRFMQQVHKKLQLLAGEKNPLDRIAQDIASESRVICFDEFFVSDITDAMILGTLFERLFELGVTLVATSNIIPDQLYANGLQRQRFLPAIAALKKHCEVFNLDGGVDYRLRSLEQAELYHFPLDAAADKSLLQSFNALSDQHAEYNHSIELNSRQFTAKMHADDVVWFDFKELCDKPRSQNDYIELARIYHAVLLSNVPQMGRYSDDQARRFINLVDEFYDRQVKLVISAAVAIDELYTGGGLNFEIERTQSRLLEMQSRSYLALPHKP
jgi:cell division protein ZapE